MPTENAILPIIKAVALIGSYAFLGFGIKYIDQAYDVKIFNRTIARALAVICGILMGLLIALDETSAMILLAIIVGVAITRKIDNYAFYAGAILAFITPIFFDGIRIHWMGLAGLIIAGTLDEELNNYADKRKLPKIISTLLYLRLIMKLTILAYALAGQINIIYFFAFIAFDISYILVDQYTAMILKRKPPFRKKLATINTNNL
ncbi:Uncharacterised protein [uncultured archaeon]|nr:Uncharacterised protein [uncultured archaeon]